LLVRKKLYFLHLKVFQVRRAGGGIGRGRRYTSNPPLPYTSTSNLSQIFRQSVPYHQTAFNIWVFVNDEMCFLWKNITNLKCHLREIRVSGPFHDSGG
jgi:hypothetical protein